MDKNFHMVYSHVTLPLVNTCELYDDVASIAYSITCKLVRTLVDRQLYPFATRYSYPPPMTSSSGGLYLNTVSFSQGAGLGALPERCVTTGSKGKQLE